MSQDVPRQGKSRRRFLADMLFLGGTVTAASLLAKSTIFQETGQNPVPEPVSTPVALPSETPFPGQMVLPEGDYVEPKVECEPTPDMGKEPRIEGRRVAPREPVPTGAAPIRYEPTPIQHSGPGAGGGEGFTR